MSVTFGALKLWTQYFKSVNLKYKDTVFALKYFYTTFYSSVDKLQFEYSILDNFAFIIFRADGLISNSINLFLHIIEYKIDQQLLPTRSNLPNLQQ